MKETTTIPRIDTREPNPNKQKQKALGTGVAVGLIVVISLLFAGMKIQAARYDKPLQGNEACKQAMAAQTKQLQANINAQFGTPIPEGTPTAQNVLDLQKQCDSTFEMYTIKVASTNG